MELQTSVSKKHGCFCWDCKREHVTKFFAQGTLYSSAGLALSNITLGHSVVLITSAEFRCAQFPLLLSVWDAPSSTPLSISCKLCWLVLGKANNPILCFLSSKPEEDQKLIYSGKLLLDHHCLGELLPKV